MAELSVSVQAALVHSQLIVHELCSKLRLELAATNAATPEPRGKPPAFLIVSD